MYVTNWQCAEQADAAEVSADIDGFRLWFRFPTSYPVSRSGDPFLVSALFPAMRRGEKLSIDPRLPVSPKLLENVRLLQEIFHSWNPEQLKRVPISATTSRAEPLNAGAMSFFSGGVDSTYTLLKRAEQISHVVFMHGMDFYFTSGGAGSFSVADLKDLAQFAWKLMLPHDPVSAFLQDRLSRATRQALAQYQDSGSHPAAAETALAVDLERIIAGPSIYEAKRFRRVGLRLQTRQLATDSPREPDATRLNRLLLEDAYPQEISRADRGTYRAAIARNSRFVESFGKVLIPVENNHYAFGYRYNLSRNLTAGSVLASVALLLGFPRAFVPSAHPYTQLIRVGSHPLTDPLWSNECTRIVHDGAEASRTDKLKRICERETALANLRVCFDDMDVNCGRCAKCLRTMISLSLLRGSAAPFPPLPPLAAIRNSRILDDVEMTFLKENVDLAWQAGERELRSALCACKKRSERIKLVREIDRMLLGGRIERAYRKIVPGIRRIDFPASPTPRGLDRSPVASGSELLAAN